MYYAAEAKTSMLFDGSDVNCSARMPTADAPCNTYGRDRFAGGDRPLCYHVPTCALTLCRREWIQ
jgi:hypothetical protein